MLDERSEEMEFWSRVDDPRARRRRSAPSARPTKARPPVRPASRSHHTGAIPRQLPATQAIPVTRSVSVTPVAPRGATNPGLRRAGVLGATVLLLVPVAMALRAEAQGRPAATLAPQTTAVTVVATAAPTGPSRSADPTVAVEAPTTPASIDLAGLPDLTPSSRPPTTKRAVRTAAATPKPVARCTPYTIAAGDAWLSIAHRAQVSLTSLLAVNNARTSTPLYPGRTLCLPAGATVPVTTVRPPARTISTATATKTATKGTSAPTTTAPELVAPANTYSRDEVIQIIRDIWPDDLEDHAIAIADRESHLNPTSRNFCCYGLFQIYFSVHRAWLASIGVTNAAQLWDPRVNATVAYKMYLRSGFAPWGG